MKIKDFPDIVKKLITKYYIQKTKSEKRKIQLILGVVLLAISISTFVYHHNLAYAIKLNGKEIGIVKNKSDFLEVVEEIKKDLHNTYATDIVFNENIDFEKVKVEKEELTTKEELKSALKQIEKFETKAYGIEADGKVITALLKKEDANKVLEEIKKKYIDEEDEDYEKVGFLENVRVRKVTVKLKDIKDYKNAANFILQGTEETKIHEVQKGESFWTIAKKYNLTVEDLIKANPDIQPEHLQINQKISLVVPKPLLTVVTVEKKRYEEKIPYEIEIEKTPALFKDENKIKVEGKEGKKEVLAKIEKHNGIEVSRDTIEQIMLESPQTQVVLQGTKPLPPKMGTGSLSNPTRGVLTSRFGWRWGRKHTGIDIAAKIGTTVRAADGGKVVFVGVKSGYGKLVIIDHGANLQTYYAHNSKIVVSKGQRVYKGQKIAEVGNTGRSTGPHLHFEVRKNGVPINPLKYVKY